MFKYIAILNFLYLYYDQNDKELSLILHELIYNIDLNDVYIIADAATGEFVLNTWLYSFLKV